MDQPSERRVALLIAPLSSFISPFMGSSINVALKAMERDLALDAVLLGWVQTAFLVASAAVLIPAGRLSDIFGRRRVFLLGTAIFTVASLMAGLAMGPVTFLTSRMLQGIGSAMMVATAVPILVSVFPPEKRGRVIGINVAAVYVGLSMGPLLGGVLTHHVSWRAIFLLSVPLGVAVWLLARFRFRGEWADARGERFDGRGAFIYALAVPALMVGITLLPALTGIALAAVGLTGLVLFGALTLRSHSPLYPVRALFENRMFGLSNLAALASYASSFGVPFLLSLSLQHLWGLDAASAGLVLVAQPAVMAVVTTLAGRLSDRVEPRVVVSAGIAMHLIGLVVLSRLDAGASLWFVGGLLAWVGCGLGLFSSPNVSAIVGSVPRQAYGVAAASAGTMRQMGQTLSMGLVTLLAARIIGAVQIGPHQHQALLQTQQIAFLILAGVACLGLVASLLRGRMHDGSQPLSG